MKDRRTLNLISRIKDSMNQFLISELEKHGVKGIVPSHGEILRILYLSNEPLSLKTIAQRIGRTQPTVTVLIRKLEKFGFVTRSDNPQDKRSSNIELTAKGKEFQKHFKGISKSINQKLHQNLTETEADLLERLLNRIHQSL